MFTIQNLHDLFVLGLFHVIEVKVVPFVIGYHVMFSDQPELRDLYIFDGIIDFRLHSQKIEEGTEA